MNTTSEDLKNQLIKVGYYRESKEAIQKELKQLRESVAETEIGKVITKLEELLGRINTALTEAELFARSLAVQAYQETGEKKPVSGAEVKMFTTVEITDQNAALLWALQNAPDTVSLDADKLGRKVKGLTLPFILVHEEPRGQIAKNLEIVSERKEDHG